MLQLCDQIFKISLVIAICSWCRALSDCFWEGQRTPFLLSSNLFGHIWVDPPLRRITSEAALRSCPCCRPFGWLQCMYSYSFILAVLFAFHPKKQKFWHICAERHFFFSYCALAQTRWQSSRLIFISIDIFSLGLGNVNNFFTIAVFPSPAA